MKGIVVGHLLCEGPIRAKHACVLHARILWNNLVALSPNDYQASTCFLWHRPIWSEVFTQIPESHFMVVCQEPGLLQVTMLSRSLLVCYTMEADTGHAGQCNALQEQAPSGFGASWQLLANKTTSGTSRWLVCRQVRKKSNAGTLPPVFPFDLFPVHCSANWAPLYQSSETQGRIFFSW